MENTQFYDMIAEDSKQALIQLVSEAGHGKTSSLRTIIQHIRTRHPDIVFKIFDVSQAWYHNSPTKYRQLVKPHDVVDNVEDCVYEMGLLNEKQCRAFVGDILEQDSLERYHAGLNGTLNNYPFILYVFEESNIYFGSYSFRTNDKYSTIFQKYASVGRNFKQRGFLICTAEQGEMAPSLRKRTRKIYGRVINQTDLRTAKKTGVTVDLVTIPKYNFAYRNYVVRVPDAVHHTPETHILEPKPIVVRGQPTMGVVHVPKTDDLLWIKFGATLFFFILFWSWLMTL